MPHPHERSYAFLVIPTLLIGLASAGTLLWWLPRRRLELIWENERNASIALRVLVSAEEDFKVNDRDWNHIQDFWTGDIAGLYYITTGGQEIHLIPRELAEADAAPLRPLVPTPVPYHGYLFVAMDWDDTGDKPEALKQNTDGSGALRHLKKAAWCAYPSVPGETGKRTYFYAMGMDGECCLLGTDNEGRPVRRWPKGGGKAAWSIID
jgi:hypothetical protein